MLTFGVGRPRSQSGLTSFAAAKAESFIRNRLSCLGCHELHGEGGRIGPPLDGVGARLSRTDIEAVIVDPQSARPGGVMPRIPMPADVRELVVAYLAMQTDPASPRAATSVGEVAPDTATGAGSVLYARYCAACHGAAGQGDGFNAQYLPVQPTAHAHAGYMSTRPDDVLFDGVYAGGYILGRSHRMPPYGATLTREQVWSLVRYLRVLCDCQGPAWSRDND